MTVPGLKLSTAPVLQVQSEKFQDNLDTLDFLERHYNSYQSNQIRKPLFDRVGVDVPFPHSKFVERVYETVISDAKKVPGHQEILRKTGERQQSTLDRIGVDLPPKSEFVKLVHEAAMKDPDAFPDEQEVLETRGKPRSTLVSAARLREIVEWTTTGKEMPRPPRSRPRSIRPLPRTGFNLRNNQLMPRELRNRLILLLPTSVVILSGL